MLYKVYSKTGQLLGSVWSSNEEQAVFHFKMRGYAASHAKESK